MAETVLEGNQQVFVVQQLACFARAKDVQEALKQNFGVEITLQGVCYYDVSNPKLPKNLKTLFKSTRTNFLKDSSKIPIAHKTYRLAKLQQMFETEENQPAALQDKKAKRLILEQAAKESGDVFTNKSQVQVSDPKGGPVKITVEVVKSVEMPAAESAPVKSDESHD